MSVDSARDYHYNLPDMRLLGICAECIFTLASVSTLQPTLSPDPPTPPDDPPWPLPLFISTPDVIDTRTNGFLGGLRGGGEESTEQ